MIDRDRNSLTRTLTFLKEIFSALLLTSQVSTNLPSLSETPHFSHCRVTVTNPLPFSLTACVCVYVRVCACVCTLGVVPVCTFLCVCVCVHVSLSGYTPQKVMCLCALFSMAACFLFYLTPPLLRGSWKACWLSCHGYWCKKDELWLVVSHILSCWQPCDGQKDL